MASCNGIDQAQFRLKKLGVICDVLSRKITIGVSVDDENEGTQGEDTA